MSLKKTQKFLSSFGINYSLSKLKKLKRLDLGNTQISDISPLSELKKLQWLNLGNTQVSDISPLSELKKLERLDLDYTEISDISPLSELKNLKRLYLGNFWGLQPTKTHLGWGCKHRTWAEWDNFFYNSDEVIQTPRNSDEFKQLVKTYEIVRTFIQKKIWRV